jgi:cell division protein FtsL
MAEESKVIRNIVIAILAVVSIVGMLSGYIWYRNDINRLANEVHQLRKSTVALQQEKADLMASKIKLEQFTRIARLAKTKIGMMPAQEKPKYMVVSTEKYEWMNE